MVLICLVAAAAWGSTLIPDANPSWEYGPLVTHTIGRSDLAVTVTEQGTLESSDNTEIKCKVRGQSTVIWVIEGGAEVKPGDELVRLDTLALQKVHWHQGTWAPVYVHTQTLVYHYFVDLSRAFLGPFLGPFLKPFLGPFSESFSDLSRILSRTLPDIFAIPVLVVSKRMCMSICTCAQSKRMSMSIRTCAYAHNLIKCPYACPNACAYAWIQDPFQNPCSDRHRTFLGPRSSPKALSGSFSARVLLFHDRLACGQKWCKQHNLA